MWATFVIATVTLWSFSFITGPAASEDIGARQGISWGFSGDGQTLQARSSCVTPPFTSKPYAAERGKKKKARRLTPEIDLS